MKSPPKGVSKKVTVYSGSCTSNNDATMKQIKQKFLDTVQGELFMTKMLCSANQGKDCTINNVKVYCGKDSRKRRKRSLGTNVYVIAFDIQVIDKHPSSDEQIEKRILGQVAADLDAKNAEIEKASVVVILKYHRNNFRNYKYRGRNVNSNLFVVYFCFCNPDNDHTND